MMLCETYQVNREQSKAAQREKSFTCCLIVLIVFFFLYLILLLANIPWKRQDEEKEQYTELTPQFTQYSKQYKEHMEETTAMPTVLLTSQTTLITTPSTAESGTLSTSQTISKTAVSTAKSTTTESTSPTEYSKQHEERTEVDLTNASTQHPLRKISTASTAKSASMSEIVIDESSSKTSINESHSAKLEEINSTSAVLHKDDAEIITTKIIEQTWKEDDVNNDTAFTSPNESITSISKLTYNTQIAITNVTISKFVTEETTSNYTDYFSNESSSEFSKKLNMASSPSASTNLEENTSAKYSSDEDHSAESQSDNTTNDTISLTSRSDVEYINNRNSIVMDERSQNYILNDTSSATSSLPNDVESSASTKYHLRSQFPNTTNTTLANDTITRENVTRDISYSTSHNYNLLPDEKFSTRIMSETSEKYTTSATFSTTKTTTLISSNYSTTTMPPTSYDMGFSSTTTTVLPNENDTCNTSHCRWTASKILSYMNDAADPCSDFYEYACGGFEANPSLIDMDQTRKFSHYQRIKKQMMKEKRENASSTFATYYDSCVKYQRTVSLNERIKMAKDALDEIGNFYINDMCSADRANFTDLFAKLILRDSAFLFDVVPEVDEYHPNSFTLKIGPTIYESPFKTEHMLEDSCSENDLETNSYVDFKVLYERYQPCKKQDEKDEIRKSVSDALMLLKVFEGLNNTDLELEHVNKIVNVIDSVLMQGYFSHFPTKSDARQVYLMNDYRKINLKELEQLESSAFVNWTHLIVSLTKVNEIIDKDIQVYFLDEMLKGLQKLKEFAEINCTDLHNAIMALYARKLYQELVLSRQNAKNHCLQMATYLLRPEATNLYISSFADHEVERINKKTTNMFEELKETLKQNVRNATWAKGKGKQALLDKTDSLELALPLVSYLRNISLLYNDYNMSQNTLSENYFSDSIILMKRYRILMYAEIRRDFNISEQIWTYYATPFQSQTKIIYSINQIVIPYGIIDWIAINNEDSLNYISLATLGNIIALQIVHHFDELGIFYWNQTRNARPLMFEDSYTSENFQNYIFDQKENSFQELNFLLPFTNQNVSLTIPQLALNKQLSQRTGLRLTYDTLDRTRSKEKDLPWIKFHSDKLFYLAYAQMYCTKTPLTPSYIALHESEDLPNRVHVFVTMFKNTLIDTAWGCLIDQCDTCDVFPHINVKESATAKLE